MENLCLKSSEKSANILGRQSEYVFRHLFIGRRNPRIPLQTVLHGTLTAQGEKFPNRWTFVAPNLAFSHYALIHLLSPSLELFEDSNCVLFTSAFPVFTLSTAWVS